MDHAQKDYIISGSRAERYACIEYAPSHEIEYYCYGRMIENRMPARLEWLLHEHGELVRQVVLTLLDDVEEEIRTYDLRLESTGQKIFDLTIIGEDLSFFTRYALSDGYLEQYPGDDLPNGPAEKKSS
ncbi:hypothetical protein [Saccharibacillus deserti]|uniref:hypothetical protein n=1 Tax=Saccharibacillus deserti TaxID=1634444 RepID=UPI0015535521|nr:hypothetical protein [Saccharibacillus deserti]